MHDSRKVFLLETEPRCVTAAYDAGEDASTTEFKTFDLDIKTDDYVIVPTNCRHKMTVCKVHAVDVEPDLDSSAEMRWVIGVVDQSAFKATFASERQFIDAARSAERRRKKTQLREDFLADIDDDMKVLSGPTK